MARVNASFRTWLTRGGLLLLVVLPVPLALPAPAPAPVPRPDTAPRVEPAAHRTYTETIPDSRVHFDMIAIPGGVFWMGTPDGEKGRADDEGPRHPVRIRPFWMERAETTWDEFDQYWKRGNVDEARHVRPVNPDADAVTRPTPPYADETWGYGREGYPVIAITHHAAMEYCRWLSRKTGKLYRLPTEAEWEWAARAGTPTAYSFGNDPARLGLYAWFADNAEDQTHPVGTKLPNRWGLYDLYGNAAEWCLDHYRKNFYASFAADRLALAPYNPTTADRAPDVVRGGSWADKAGQCRSGGRRASDRSWWRSDPQRPPSIWWLPNADFVGFRVVRAVEEQDDLRDVASKVTRNTP
jgi:formylglycine-generating enzyme required for sulfatase activity